MRKQLFRYAAGGLLSAAALLLTSCVTPPVQAAGLDVTGAVDFQTIIRLAEMYRIMRYDTPEQTRAVLGPRYDQFSLVELPATRNLYTLGVSDSGRVQEISIRGTANFRNAISDVEFGEHMNVKLKVDLHRGFEAMAMAVYNDVLPRLRKDYPVVIFGHSLGAGEAVILGMLLSVDGFTVSHIYASGQPRVTDAAGAERFAYLPILRIVDEGDPVPDLPPRSLPSASDHYVHFGTELYLLDGPYYCLVGQDTGDDALAGDLWKALAKAGEETPIRNHLMPAYIERLTPKLDSALHVPYAERTRYVSAPGSR
jgi:triacylglycerol lipase